MGMTEEQIQAMVTRLANKPALGPSRIPPPELSGPASPATPEEIQRGESVRSFARETLPPMLGSTAMILASRGMVGGPAGLLRAIKAGTSLPGRAGLSGLGGAGGEAVAQIIEQMLGRGPKTGTEAARRIGTAGLIEGAAQGGGELVFQRVLEPFKRQLEPGAERLFTFFKESPLGQRLSERAEKAGVPLLTPGEASRQPMIVAAENVADRFVVSRSIMRSAREGRLREVQEPFVAGVVEEFSQALTPDEVARVIVNIAEGRADDLTMKTIKPIYNAIDQELGDRFVTRQIERVETGFGIPPQRPKGLIGPGPGPRTVLDTVEVVEPGFPIDFSEVNKAARRIIATAPEAEGTLAEIGGQGLARAVEKFTARTTFTKAAELRSNLLGMQRSLSATKGAEKGAGRARELLALVDQAVERDLKSFDPSLADAWRHANELVKKRETEINPLWVKELSKKLEREMMDPKAVEPAARRLFRPGDPNPVRNIKKVVGGADTPTFEQVQSFFINDLIFIKSVDNKTAEISGGLLRTKLNEFNKALPGRPSVLDELFEGKPGVKDNLFRLADFLELTQKRGKAGNLAVAIQTTKPVTDAMQLSFRAGGNIFRFIGGASVTAKMFADPRMSRVLTEGARMAIDDPKTAGLMGRALSLVAQRGWQDMFRVEVEPVDEKPLFPTRLFEEARQPRSRL